MISSPVITSALTPIENPCHQEIGSRRSAQQHRQPVGEVQGTHKVPWFLTFESQVADTAVPPHTKCRGENLPTQTSWTSAFEDRFESHPLLKLYPLGRRLRVRFRG